MPVKKARTLTRPIRRKKGAPSRKVRSSRAAGRPAGAAAQPHRWFMTHEWAVVVGAICVLGAVALIATPQPSPTAESVSIEPLSDANTTLDVAADANRTTAVDPQVPVAQAAAINQRGAEKIDDRKVRPVVNTASPLEEPRSVKGAIAELPLADAPVAASTTKAPAEPEATAPSTAPNVPADVRTSRATEISGCLEFDDGTFRLRDTTGADLPTARSWKSGFLRKRPSTIEVVDAQTPRLQKFVGQRVAATGTLVDRQMQVHSMKALGVCS
jgi:hypothetical protein